MNRQKLACLGLVLSIFAWFGAASAQQFAPDELNLTVPAATWVQSAGPETGNALAFLRRGSRLYLGTYGGLWLSEDNGENWARTNFLRGFAASNRVTEATTALAANSTTIFVGTEFGLYRSIDEGQTWTASNNGFPAARPIQELFVHGNNVYAVTFNGELFASTNNGESWARLTNGLPNVISAGGGIFGLNISSGGSLVGTNTALFLRNTATNPPELYRSLDQGQSWTKLELQLPQGVQMLALAANSNRVFLGTTQGLLASTDDGQTWQPVNGLPPVGNNFGYVPYLSGTTVYVSLLSSSDPNAESIVYVSTDNGFNWTQKGRLPFTQVYDILVEGQTVFYGHPTGVIRTSDGGASYQIKNKGLRSALTFSEIVVLGNRIYVSSHGGGLWVTSDNGTNWRQLKNGWPFAAFPKAVGAVGNTLYAALEQPFGFYRSTDFGENWTRIGNGLPPANASPNVIAGHDGKLYLGMFGGGLWVSSDNGENWMQVTGGIPTTANVWSLAFKGNAIFATTNGTGAFRSTDGGNSFVPINTGLTVPLTRGLLVVGDTIFLASNALYRSTDNGDTWTPVFNGIVDSITRNGNTLYVVGPSVGAYMSRDNGDTWQVNNTGLFGLVRQIASSGNQIVAASRGSGVFFQTVDDFAAVSAASFSPNAVAEKAIVSAFGTGLATTTATASSLPLPSILASTIARVRDSAGNERPAPLFFVSPSQINFQIPAGTAPGTATITVMTGSGATIIGTADIKPSAPSIFTMNAGGTGAAAAVDAFTGARGPFNATQANGQSNIIAVFGTGLGGDATDVDGNVSASVTARIGGAAATVLYAGRAPGFVGLNQFNLVLPTGITSGTHTLTITRGGVPSNSVTIAIR